MSSSSSPQNAATSNEDARQAIQAFAKIDLDSLAYRDPNQHQTPAFVVASSSDSTQSSPSPPQVSTSTSPATCQTPSTTATVSETEGTAVGTSGRPRDVQDSPLNDDDDDELIAVLGVLNIADPDEEERVLNDDLAAKESPENLSPLELLDDPGELPEIDIYNFDGQGPVDSFLLEPLEELDRIFDVEQDDLEDQDQDGGSQNKEDQDVLGLLEDLGDLKLDTGVNNTEELYGDIGQSPQTPSHALPDQDTDELPPYFYCQPCTPIEEQKRQLLESFDKNNIDWIGDTTHPDDDIAIGGSFALQQRLLGLPSSFIESLNQKDIDYLMRLSVLLEQHPYDNMLSPTDHPDNTTESEEPQEGAVEGTSEGDYESRLQEQRKRPLRKQALDAAKIFLDSFDAKICSVSNDDSASSKASRERMCLGHKERILGMDISDCGRYLATASQDSTVCVWHIATNKLLTTLDATASKDFECLRVVWASSTWGQDRMQRIGNENNKNPRRHLLATGGANGIVQMWACPDLEVPSVKFESLATLDHSTFSHFHPSDEGDKPQVYALQFIDHWQALPNDDGQQNSFLLSSSDDHVHLWEVDDAKKSRSDEDGASGNPVYLREVLSFRFGDMHAAGYGVSIWQVSGSGMKMLQMSKGSEDGKPVEAASKDGGSAFGGDRNPRNLVYVFDASYCAANGLLGVALSDGSLRLMNGRGVCLSLLTLPGSRSHLTSFAWDEAGHRLATTVATGQVVIWTIGDTSSAVISDASLQSQTHCRAVLQGGHELGRPLFGAQYIGDDLLLTWGADGRLCLWDSQATEEVYEPMSILVDKNEEDYPIYACCCANFESQVDENGVVAVAGGAGDGGLIGVPVYLYDARVKKDDDQQKKKSKTSGD